MNLNNLVDEYKKVFDSHLNVKGYFAPGRVNLIGGHVDYHGGFVLPCAINYGTYMLMAKRSDQMIKGYSMNFEDQGIIIGSLDNLKRDLSDDWFSYVKGLIKILKENGYEINEGFNLLLNGNIPNGAGLSSSASLEIVLLEGLKDLFDLQLTTKEMVIIAQAVENDYIGVNCGIMDQYAVAFGKNDHAILLDCEKVEHEYVPLHLKDNKIMIVNSNKQRKLSESKYNERRTESTEALEIILGNSNKKIINQLTMDDFEASKELIKNETKRKRAKHVITENLRTEKAHNALIRDDLSEFGECINGSHKSLKEDYEVSCNELDYIAEYLQTSDGVLGARMTGAGFGGCVVSIINESVMKGVGEELTKHYKEKFGYKPSIYIADVGNGSNKIDLEK
jgi:galactokinase